MEDTLRSLLDPDDPGQDHWFVTKVAACAILMELAGADGETAPVEVKAIEEAMRTRFGIDGDVAALVSDLARKVRDDDSASDVYARFVREVWSPADRATVLEAVRDVVWADGRLDPGEEAMVWRLAASLGLPFDLVRGTLASG